MSMHAARIMMRNVVAVSLDLPVEEVAQVLAEHRISAVPVIDDEHQLKGMVTFENLVHAPAERRPHWRALLSDPKLLVRRCDGRTARNVMSRDLVTVEETTPLQTLIQLLAKRPIKRLPVVQDGRLVGIISRVDVLRALA